MVYLHPLQSYVLVWDPCVHSPGDCREAWPGLVYGLTVGGWGTCQMTDRVTDKYLAPGR